MAHTQAHHLEPAGIGVGGAVPVLEGGNAAGLVNNVGARLKVEMVGVGQHRLCACSFDLLGGERFHGCLGAHGDKRWGVNIAMRGVDRAGAPIFRELRAHGEARVCLLCHGR